MTRGGTGLWFWLALGSSLALSGVPVLAADLSYVGRLVEVSGAPVAGPVDLEIRFYHGAGATTPVSGIAPLVLTGVVLDDGVFQAPLGLTESELHAVFPGGPAVTFLEVKDVTNDRVYPRQEFTAVPYALKVPIDPTTLGYTASGLLTVTAAPAPGVTPDGQNGALVLGTNDASMLTFETANAPRMTIDATGKIGIGTATPGQKLSVAGAVESTSGGFKFPDGSLQASAAGPRGIVNLVDGASIAVDASAGNVFSVTLASGAGRVLADPTNLPVGTVLTFRIQQDATGSRLLGYGANYFFTGGYPPTLSVTPGAVDILQFFSDGTALYFSGKLLNAKAVGAFRRSCLEILAFGASVGNGDYDIDPDGAGSKGLVTVYCDMTTDGGGYTFLDTSTSSGRLGTTNVCSDLGMALLIPKSSAHHSAVLARAGGMYLPGLFPDVAGQTNRALWRWFNSVTAAWVAGSYFDNWQGGEPSGDNSAGFSATASGASWNDLPAAGTSVKVLCSTNDK